MLPNEEPNKRARGPTLWGRANKKYAEGCRKEMCVSQTHFLGERKEKKSPPRI